jgi:hypothetical protein
MGHKEKDKDKERRKSRKPSSVTLSDASSDSDRASHASSTAKDRQTSGEKSSRKSSADSAEQGEMISKDKQEQAQRMLETVEGVLRHIADKKLTGAASVAYILHNSVDVQRIATLQQLHQHIDFKNDEEGAASVFTEVLEEILAHSSEVQIAAANGISKILSELSPTLAMLLYDAVSPLVQGCSGRSARESPGLPAAVAAVSPPPDPGIGAPGLGAPEASPPAKRSTLPDPSTAAWCALLHNIIRRLPHEVLPQVFADQVISRVASQSSTTEKLFGIETLVVIIEVLPEAGHRAGDLFVSLAADPSAAVRTATAQGMSRLFPCLSAIAIREQLIIAVLTLLADRNLDVSSAMFLTAIEMPKYAGKAFADDLLRPILRQYVTNAPPQIQLHVMRNFGPFLWSLKDSFDPLPAPVAQRLKLEFEDSTAKPDSPSHASKRPKSTNPTTGNSGTRGMTSPRGGPRLVSPRARTVSPPRSPKRANAAVSFDPFDFDENDWLFLTTLFRDSCGSAEESIRTACAFNLPAVMASVPPELRPEIFHCAHLLARDLVAKVRAVLAAGFHELCSFAQDPLTQVLPLITRLISDSETSVKEKFFRNLTAIFKAANAALATAGKRDAFFESLTPLIITYEKEIHTNWRKVAGILEHMQQFPEWFSSSDLFSKYVPLLVSHLVSGAAALSRRVCRTIALFLRRFSTPDECVKVLVAVRNMTAVLARNKSAAGRMGFVTLVAEMLQTFSQEFVKAVLIASVVPLAQDKIVNVRIHLARYAPTMKRYPAIASAIEKSVCATLCEDPEIDVRNALASAEAAIPQTARNPVFDADVNRMLLAEEGPHLLSAEVVKRAAEALEAATKAAAASPPANLLSASRRKEDATRTVRR